MRRAFLSIGAVAGASVLAGCVGYVPVPAGPQVVYQQPAPRYYHSHQRDSDRDGVPDRYDRRPYNPYRY